MFKAKYYFDKALEILLSIIMLIMSLVVLWQVFTRFVLDDPSTWSEELARYLMVWLGFLGGAVGLKYGAHLGLTLIIERIKKDSARMIFQITGNLLCIIMGFIILIYGYEFMIEGHTQRALSMPFEMSYVYFIIPFSGLVVILNSLELIYLSTKNSNKLKQNAGITV